MEHSPIQIPPLEALAAVPAPIIAAAIDQLIEALDVRDGDPDLEEEPLEDAFIQHPADGPGCPFADPGGSVELDYPDQSWPEWHTRGRHKVAEGGTEPVVFHEDDEDDDPDTSVEDSPLGFDPEEDMCLAGDDRVFSGPVMGGGNYLPDQGPGDADDAEREQMHDDVPCLRVYGLEPNPFNGARPYLGMNGHLGSFLDNGKGVLSLETGQMQFRNGDLREWWRQNEIAPWIVPAGACPPKSGGRS